MAAKEALTMAIEMLTKIASTREHCLGSTTRVGAAPGSLVIVQESIVVQICRHGGRLRCRGLGRRNFANVPSEGSLRCIRVKIFFTLHGCMCQGPLRVDELPRCSFCCSLQRAPRLLPKEAASFFFFACQSSFCFT